MNLPEQAGKLPWTDGSLMLLQNLQQEMLEWNNPVDEGYTSCDKPDCHFCSLTRSVERVPHPEFIMSKANNHTTSGERWSKEEMQLLTVNIKKPFRELVEMFPERNYTSVNDKKRKLKSRSSMIGF